MTGLRTMQCQKGNASNGDADIESQLLSPESVFFRPPLIWNGRPFSGSIGKRNLLIWGENLAAMRALPERCIDLIYADPPFFTNREFGHLYDSTGATVFSDVWHVGLAGYIAWLRSRVTEMKRLLKDSGSIYLHLDWHASHYAKVMMDSVFGYDNFLNEVIWHYKDPAGTVRDRFKKKHDTILLYAKRAGRHKFNLDAVRVSYSKGTIRQGELGIISFGRPTKLNSLGKVPEDVWDIPIINSQARERLGYPTQKPSRLLETIVRASSSPGDTVADFFCGSGTTPAVAMANGRRWIAADSNSTAVSTTMKRLNNMAGRKNAGSRPLFLSVCVSGNIWKGVETGIRQALGLKELNCEENISLLPDGHLQFAYVENSAEFTPAAEDSGARDVSAVGKRFYAVRRQLEVSPYNPSQSGICAKLMLPPSVKLTVKKLKHGAEVSIVADEEGIGIISAAKMNLEFQNGNTNGRKISGDFTDFASGTASIVTERKGRCVVTATVRDSRGCSTTVIRPLLL